MCRGLVGSLLAGILGLYAVASDDTRFSIIAPLAEHSLLLDASIAGKSVIAVGERGHVLRSEDMGETWTQVLVPTRVTLTAIAFGKSGLGFAVGHDGTVLRTTNGGNAWQLVRQDADEDRPLLDVYVIDSQHVVAVGGYGLYLESLDGGVSWRVKDLVVQDDMQTENTSAEQDYPDDYHLNAFAVSKSGLWYMAAEAGMIYRSSDRGSTWQRLSSPYPGSLLGILTWNHDQVMVFGLQGSLYHSSNQGTSWQGVDTNTQVSLTSAEVLADGRILITGYSGSLIISDADLSDLHMVRLSNRMGISAALQSTDGNLLLFGSKGVIRFALSGLSQG